MTQKTLFPDTCYGKDSGGDPVYIPELSYEKFLDFHKTYYLSLIHIYYEVSRSLAACDGAILVVDAAQGIEAQTLANVYLALDHDLDVFPVINKIDLPSARPDWVADEIEDVIGIEAHDAPRISAKTGLHVEDVLEAIVHLSLIHIYPHLPVYDLPVHADRE